MKTKDLLVAKKNVYLESNFLELDKECQCILAEKRSGILENGINGPQQGNQITGV